MGLWTPEFERFVAPARAAPQLWRLLLGAVLGTAVYVATLILLFAAAGRWADPVLEGGLQGHATPQATLLLLYSFAGMALGAVTAAAVHRRGPLSLFGDRARLGRDFRRAAGWVLLCYGVVAAVSLPLADPEPNLPVGLWLRLLPLSLAGILLQVTAEEMVFRGYLLQQLAARFRHPALWMGLPSLLFALGHYTPEAPATGALAVAATLLFGLAATDLVRLTGSLGAAIGFHFANNVFALLITAVKGPLAGLALWVTPFSQTDTEALAPWMLLDALVVVALWALLRRLFRAPAG